MKQQKKLKSNSLYFKNRVCYLEILTASFLYSTTLIISKKPRNTGKLRDRDTEFTTDLLHSDRALTRCSFP